jgi:signal transduction histidine kinase
MGSHDALDPSDRAWTVVVRADGTIDDVDGGAPVTWVGHRIGEDGCVPGSLVEPFARLLERDGASSMIRHAVTTLRSAGSPVPVHLLLCEAIPIRRSHVRVRDLVLRVLDMFRAQAKSGGLELNAEFGTDVPEAFFLDGEKIVWALSMLTATALRLTPAHTARGARGSVSIRVDGGAHPGEVVFRVLDNGPGMPASRARWLFERNPATGRAAGVALLMVRDIVAAHGGTIAVDSLIDCGTTFTLRIRRFDLAERRDVPCARSRDACEARRL